MGSIAAITNLPGYVGGLNPDQVVISNIYLSIVLIKRVILYLVFYSRFFTSPTNPDPILFDSCIQFNVTACTQLSYAIHEFKLKCIVENVILTRLPLTN